jgi:hypothetical protein
MSKSIQANTKISSLFKIHFSIILLFITGFLTNMLHAFSISPMHATCPDHLIILAFLTFTSHKVYKCSSLCSILHPLVTSSLLAPPILLSTLFSDLLYLSFPLTVTDQISGPHKTGKLQFCICLCCRS